MPPVRLAPRDELDAAWQVVAAASQAAGPDQPELPPLATAPAEAVLREWDAALAAVLAGEELDGLATALYTVGAPVRIDALFDAYSSAAGSRRQSEASLGATDTNPGATDASPGATDASPGATGASLGATDHDAVPSDARPSPSSAGKAGQPAPSRRPDADEAAALSHALETLADLGVVELGTEDHAGGLTVVLSPLGVWGVHRRLLAQGWHVPVLGVADRDGAVGLLTTLASCD